MTSFRRVFGELIGKGSRHLAGRIKPRAAPRSPLTPRPTAALVPSAALHLPCTYGGNDQFLASRISGLLGSKNRPVGGSFLDHRNHLRPTFTLEHVARG
jgi:hypothetical protein